MSYTKQNLEFRSKEKTIDDLARFIKNQSDSVPNYTLLLGSGCSVTSGINTGMDLVEKWRKEVFDEVLLEDTMRDEYI